MTAAEAYAARIDAVEAQAGRLRARVRDAVGSGVTADRRGDAPARLARIDPHRASEPELALLASYLEPTDVLVDVGGGSGRLGLPLALRCREVINVDPLPGMLAAFVASATEAGIKNVRAVQADWLKATEVAGDIVLAAHVTYFVRDIVSFITRLQAAARRRVMILLFSTPPQVQVMNQQVFHLIHGEAAE